MNRLAIRRFVARFFVASAYFVCMLQWLWLAMIGAPPLIESGWLDGLVTPVRQEQVEQPVDTPQELPAPAMVAIGAVTLVMIIVTVIILIRLPKAIVETGQTITHVTTKAVVPAILHHQRVSAKKRRIISRRVMLAVQIAITILPAIAVILLPVPKELPADGLLLVTLVLPAFSLFGFTAGWLLEPPVQTKKRKTS